MDNLFYPYAISSFSAQLIDRQRDALTFPLTLTLSPIGGEGNRQDLD
jgi:hypothetical protein